ncbi:hypothetical protein [Polaromonas sp.]
MNCTERELRAAVYAAGTQVQEISE